METTYCLACAAAGVAKTTHARVGQRLTRPYVIVVVDDEPDARELTRRVLIECQADVIVAKNGREALHMLLISPPEILVSDIGMPEIDGYELIRRARVRGFTAPPSGFCLQYSLPGHHLSGFDT